MVCFRLSYWPMMLWATPATLPWRQLLSNYLVWSTAAFLCVRFCICSQYELFKRCQSQFTEMCLNPTKAWASNRILKLLCCLGPSPALVAVPVTSVVQDEAVSVLLPVSETRMCYCAHDKLILKTFSLALFWTYLQNHLSFEPIVFLTFSFDRFFPLLISKQPYD